MNLFNWLFNRPAVEQLEPAQVHTLAFQSPRPYLLDVRTPQEYKLKHINGAELIPLEELSAKMTRLPKARKIICICESGSRSRVASRRLAAQGYQVANMRGGMAGWAHAKLPVKTGMGK